MEKTVKKISQLIGTAQCSFIRICGNGSSGKTLLANHLSKELQAKGFTIHYLSTDDYLLDGDAKKQFTSIITANNPISYFLPTLVRDIEMLKRNMPFLTLNDHNLLHYKGDHNELVIVEGIGASFLDKDLFDLSIFIYTTSQVEFTLRMKRDHFERKLSTNDIISRFKTRRSEFERFILPQKYKFDIILMNTGSHLFLERFPQDPL
ncbi:uridine kinase family protein [Listeria kieliensis]|uniref:Phosphoribulokinase/uridine kinase domain-containing protein n=1 Tax=Listeria kieliensis TaxID=1621700 RepID=A0A3D8TRR5_9LIST|nr:uridine kinase [Listeria kieliensis]RDX01480.1 hypothetical protein UR08_11295 [Listeria kieliensis]